jgi:hypothetical protein
VKDMEKPTLSTEAAELLTHLDAFDVEPLIQRLKDLTEQADQQNAGLDEDWDAFWTAAVALCKRAEEEESRLQGDAGELAAALESAYAAAEEGVTELRTVVDAAYAAPDDVAARIRLLQAGLPDVVRAQAIDPIASLVDEVKEVAASMVKAVESLRTAMDGAVKARIDENRQVAGIYLKITPQLAHAASHLVAALFEEWAGRLVAIVDLVNSAGFKPAASHVQPTVAESLEECEQEQKDLLVAAGDSLREAAEGLAALGSRVDEFRDSVKTGAGAVGQGAQSLTAALAAAHTRFQADLAYLAGRRFTPAGS